LIAFFNKFLNRINRSISLNHNTIIPNFLKFILEIHPATPRRSLPH
jgi:hypothetical protein